MGDITCKTVTQGGTEIPVGTETPAGAVTPAANIEAAVTTQTIAQSEFSNI